MIDATKGNSGQLTGLTQQTNKCNNETNNAAEKPFANVYAIIGASMLQHNFGWHCIELPNAEYIKSIKTVLISN